MNLLGLWSSRSWLSVTKSKECVAYPIPKHLLLLVEFTSATATKSVNDTTADPTWKGSKKILFFCNGQHVVHEYSQQ